MKLDFILFEGKKIFYHYHPKAQEKFISVFLNGLSDSHRSWHKVVEIFQHDHSFLLIDLLGQGESLQYQINHEENLNFQFNVEDQCRALSEVLTHLEIRKKINLVGFSYGGGIALKWASLHPQKIQKLILLVPFIIRLDQAHPVARFWWQQFEKLQTLPGLPGRQMQMWNRLYDHFLHAYMHQRFHDRIPSKPEREAAVQLTEEIMKFNSFEVLNLLPKASTYLLTVEKDSLVPRSLYHELWERIPDSIKKAWLIVPDGEHLLLEQAPHLVADWIEKIIEAKNSGGISSETIDNSTKL